MQTIILLLAFLSVGKLGSFGAEYVDAIEPLVAVRAFKNGNMHLHFSQKVMLAINVEAGRLLGWLRTPEQAASEMNATKAEREIIDQVFGASLRIGQNFMLKLA